MDHHKEAHRLLRKIRGPGWAIRTGGFELDNNMNWQSGGAIVSSDNVFGTRLLIEHAAHMLVLDRGCHLIRNSAGNYVVTRNLPSCSEPMPRGHQTMMQAMHAFLEKEWKSRRRIVVLGGEITDSTSPIGTPENPAQSAEQAIKLINEHYFGV